MFAFECYIHIHCPSRPGLLNNKVRHNNVAIQIVLPTLQQPKLNNC